jgi:DnaK suppressor protein
VSNLTNKKMRRKLLALRDELESVAQTSAAAAQVVELDQAKVGRLSRMDALQAQAMSQAAGRRRDAKLKMIAGALQRIDADTFGDCQSCDEPIAPKRLEFDPTVRLCIECATKQEQGKIG